VVAAPIRTSSAIPFDGQVGEAWLPEYGQVIEKKFGRIDWLHLPHFMRYPDRYHARSIKLVD
jgi:hypothetical protein